ncbi:peptidase S24/S26A/S26B/S26C, partial [Hyaloraphidium curvatum]
GGSMLPTLNVSYEAVILDTLTARCGTIRLGDVVVYRSPTNPAVSVCKRIVGLPGDTVCADPLSRHRNMVTVPEGHYWLHGDNMPESRDSRDYGPVPGGLIYGVV